MQYRHEIGHALANLAFAAVLTSSFALLAFSKYRRAQIALLQTYTPSFASSYYFLQSLPSSAFCKYRRAQIAPLTDLHSFFASSYYFLQSFPSPVFCKHRRAQIAPLTDPHSFFASSLFIKNAVAIPLVFLRVFLKNTYSLRKIARYIQ